MKQVDPSCVLFLQSLLCYGRPIGGTMLLSLLALVLMGQEPIRDSLALEPIPDIPEPPLHQLMFKHHPEALAISVLKAEPGSDTDSAHWVREEFAFDVLPDPVEPEPRQLLVYEHLPDPAFDLLASVEDGPGVLDRGSTGHHSLDHPRQLFLMVNDGLDAVKFDQMNNGQVLLIEDLTANSLTIRIQRMRTGTARLRLFSIEGGVLIDQERRSLGAGFEFTIHYEKWPPGVYRLAVELDGHLPSEKILQKPELVNMFH